jgi:uncharacterized protein YggU (UPF0235/DUF167 family)
MKLIVRGHPNSKNPRVLKKSENEYEVYVGQPPENGQANEAIIKLLAKHLKIKQNQLMIVSGLKSKTKLVELNN